jgi:hypothetical protein
MFNFTFGVVFVVGGCIVYVLAVVVSFIVVFLYCVCALNVCNVCYLSVLLLYYCHRNKAQLQFNKCIYLPLISSSSSSSSSCTLSPNFSHFVSIEVLVSIPGATTFPKK